VSLVDDSADSSGKVLNHVGKELVLEGHVRMRDMKKKVMQYRVEKAYVLRASLELEKKLSACESIGYGRV